MRESTKGIFLHFVPYADSAVIATVYTRKFGPQTFLVNGLRSAKRGSRINLFQPFTSRDGSIISGPKPSADGRGAARRSAATIPFDIKRSSQAIFIVGSEKVPAEEDRIRFVRFSFHAVSSWILRRRKSLIRHVFSVPLPLPRVFPANRNRETAAI